MVTNWKLSTVNQLKNINSWPTKNYRQLTSKTINSWPIENYQQVTNKSINSWQFTLWSVTNSKLINSCRTKTGFPPLPWASSRSGVASSRWHRPDLEPFPVQGKSGWDLRRFPNLGLSYTMPIWGESYSGDRKIKNYGIVVNLWR